ncbi:MFS general substrate transporter [Meredithblackwellia eburnea MCA 4105]
MPSLAVTHSTDTKLSTDGQVDHIPSLVHIIEEKALEEDGLDEAATALKGQSLEYTPEEERAIVRKCDWWMMPIMGLCCGLQFVDKAAISSAATFGMTTDLKLHGQQYSWGVAVFYFGYLASLYPSLLLMSKFHTGKFVGVACFLWGAVILGMVGVKTYPQLIATRVLLGIFEAPLAPGFIQVTARFYSQREQPFRYGIWTLANGWLPIPALVMYYGIGHTKNPPIAPWRIIFLVLGLLTIVAGVGVYFIVPDTPATAPFLNDRQKAIAVERIARTQIGMKNSKFKKAQLIEALTDIRAWLVVATLFLSQSGGAVTTNFLGIVIKGFGYEQLRSLLLQTPAFAIQGVVCLIVTGLATFTTTFRNLKQPMLSVAALCVVTGSAIIYSHKPTANNRHLLLGALYLMAINNCSYTTIMSVVGVNFAGQTKKSAVSAMTFVAYCVSNIVVPQAFRGNEAPTYHSGILTVLCFQVALIICYWTSWTLMTMENRRRDKLQAKLDAESGASTVDKTQEEVLQGLRDLTDRENLGFRYSP